jgi:transcriptional regulator with XRE-family HTH domain
MQSELRERLREALRRSGKKQRDIARALSIAPSSVCEWFSGSTEPTQAHLARAVEVMGMSLSDFFGLPVESAGAEGSR